MSEAIIVRGGIAAGSNVDLSWVNSSLSSINGKIDTINSNIDGIYDVLNKYEGTLEGVATNAFVTVNGYYICTKTGNYWIEVVGGGGQGGSIISGNRTYIAGGGSGYINNGTVYIDKNSEIYVTIGNAGARNQNGGTSSFGVYLSAPGGASFTNRQHTVQLPNGQYIYTWELVGGNNGEYIYTNNDIFTNCNGGWLYYMTGNNRKTSYTGTNRLYYGEGGSSSYPSTPPQSGCVIITYMD